MTILKDIFTLFYQVWSHIQNPNIWKWFDGKLLRHAGFVCMELFIYLYLHSSDWEK